MVDAGVLTNGQLPAASLSNKLQSRRSGSNLRFDRATSASSSAVELASPGTTSASPGATSASTGAVEFGSFKGQKQQPSSAQERRAAVGDPDADPKSPNLITTLAPTPTPSSDCGDGAPGLKVTVYCGKTGNPATGNADITLPFYNLKSSGSSVLASKTAMTFLVADLDAAASEVSAGTCTKDYSMDIGGYFKAEQSGKQTFVLAANAASAIMLLDGVAMARLGSGIPLCTVNALMSHNMTSP